MVELLVCFCLMHSLTSFFFLSLFSSISPVLLPTKFSAVMIQLARQGAASLLPPMPETPLRPAPFIMPVPGGQAIKVDEASKPKTE